LKKHEILLYLFFTTLFFHGFITNYVDIFSFSSGTMLVDLSFLFTICTIVIRSFSLESIFIQNNYKYVIYSFICLALLSVVKIILDTNNIEEKIFGYRNSIAYISIFLIINIIIRREKDKERLLNYIILLGTLMCLFAIMQFVFFDYLPDSLKSVKEEVVFTLENANLIRVNGLIGNSIEFSGFTLIIFALSFVKFYYNKTLFNFIVVLICITANILSFSRVAVLGLLLIAISEYIVINNFKLKHITYILIVLGMLVMMGLGAFTLISSSNNFFLDWITAEDSTTSGSNLVHFMMIDNAINYISENPWGGVGVGSQGPSSRKDNLIISDGFWLQFMLEFGIPLFGIYIIYSVLCIRCIYRLHQIRSSIETTAFISLTVYFMFANIINSTYIGKVNQVLYWTLFGLATFKCCNSKSTSNNSKNKNI